MKAGNEKKKTVRRKPPPELIINSPRSNLDEEYNSTPLVTSFGPSSTQMYPTLINTDISPKIQVAPFAGSDVYAESPNNTFHGAFEDESFVSFESPKPMGPKDLPDYATHVTPTKTKEPESSRSSDSLPYPKNYDFLDIGDEDEPYGEGEDSYENEIFPTKMSPPGSLDGETYYTPQTNRTSKIILESLETPSKIPHLNENQTLEFSERSPKDLFSHSSGCYNDMFSDLSISPSSPSNVTHLNKFSGSPSESYSLKRQSICSSKNSSPEKSPFLKRYSTASPKIGHFSPSFIGGTSSRSLSPSPTRNKLQLSDLENGTEKSPSNLVYDDIPFALQVDHHEQELSNSFRSLDELEHVPGRTTEEYFDDENPYDDSPSFLGTKNFDYSTLPELPSLDSCTQISSSPNKKLSVHSTVSLPHMKSFNSFPTFSNLKNRKDDELPPVPLELPKLPFTCSSLTIEHFSGFHNIWSLSWIYRWCLSLKSWLHGLFIPRKEFKKSVIKLLAYYRNDIPLDIISQNTDQIIETLREQGALSAIVKEQDHSSKPLFKELPLPKDEKYNQEKEDNGISIHEGVYVSGVLMEMLECYCNDNDHTFKQAERVKLKCYSFGCQVNRAIENEIRFRKTDLNEVKLGDDWVSYWKLTAHDLAKVDKVTSKRQSLLFDLLKYEQTFIRRGQCFIDVVGPEFIKTTKTLLGANEIIPVTNFEEDVIAPAKELVDMHQKKLFEPLLNILISEGKFIKSVSKIADIYLLWAKDVKQPLLRYICTVPMYEDLLKIDIIKRWVDTEIRNMDRVKELRVNGTLLLLSTFNSRYQQLPLQLLDIKKYYDSQEPEYIALTKTIDLIKNLGTKVNQMKTYADNLYELKKLRKQLIWKSNVSQINLNLGSENRKFLQRGDLTKKGDLKINSSLHHIVLLDNYLLITERIKGPKPGTFSFKIVEDPIPIEFLLFEIKEKELSSPSIDFNPIKKTLASSPVTPSSIGLNSLEVVDVDLESTAFAFKVRYAGQGKHNAYTFITKVERERKDWIHYLTMARSNLCTRLRKFEPFRMDSISNSNFVYEWSDRITKLPCCAPNDPLEVESSSASENLTRLGFAGDIYNYSNNSTFTFTKVLCSSSFHYNSTTFHLIGLSDGIFCSDMKHRWKKLCHCGEVTKIEVINELDLVFVMADKRLRYYFLNLIAAVYFEVKDQLSHTYLSSEHVTFFEVGIHKGIPMVFYAKKKSNSGVTNFKVLIPEADGLGVLSSFRLLRKFYIQAECYGVSIFNTSFIIHTNKGFDVLNLDNLIPHPIPEVPVQDSTSKRKVDSFNRRSGLQSVNPGIEIVKKAVFATNLRPMGVFKLRNNTEFLLVYNDFAVFTNKHGKLSRYSILKFDFKVKSIAFLDNFLFLATTEVLEIWSISDFVRGSNKLVQVIIGKGINIIDSKKAVCFVAANPKVPGLQLVLKLISTTV